MKTKVASSEESSQKMIEVMKQLGQAQLASENAGIIAESFLYHHGVSRDDFISRMHETDIQIGLAIALAYFAGAKGSPKFITDEPCISMIFHLFDQMMRRDHDENCIHCKGGTQH